MYRHDGPGVPRQRFFGSGIFVALDGAWRVFTGQRPVLDFHAQPGPLVHLLNALGLALAGSDSRGLGYAAALAGACLALWSFLLLRRRMAPGAFLFACLAVTLLAVSPFPPGLGTLAYFLGHELSALWFCARRPRPA